MSKQCIDDMSERWKVMTLSLLLSSHKRLGKESLLNKLDLFTIRRIMNIFSYMTEKHDELVELIKQNSYALQCVKNQTEEMCLEAVKHNGLALEFVQNQTYEVCSKALERDGNALKYIRNQTEEICLEAIKQNGRALKHVKNQTKEMCLEAIKQTVRALKHIKNQTLEICLESMKYDYYCAISCIKTRDMYDEAIRLFEYSNKPKICVKIYKKSQSDTIKYNNCIVRYI